jgi:hypothetical protein
MVGLQAISPVQQLQVSTSCSKLFSNCAVNLNAFMALL